MFTYYIRSRRPTYFAPVTRSVEIAYAKFHVL